MGRKRVNTGTVGVAGTGDTVNAGGVKIESNFEELYQAFGDQQLFDVENTSYTDGTTYQTVHPSGFFQHHDYSYYADQIVAGSKHDIKSTDSTDTYFNIYLPVIVSAVNETDTFIRRGEHIELIDSFGSWGTKFVKLIPAAGQLIDGLSEFVLSEDRKHAILTVVDINGVEQWVVKDSKLCSIEGSAIFADSIEILGGATTNIATVGVDLYNACKFHLYVEEYNAATATTINWGSSEIYLVNMNTSVMFSEFAIVKTDDLIDITASVKNNYITFTVVPKTTNRLFVTIRTIDVIRKSYSFEAPNI